MTISQKEGVGLCPASYLLLSSLLTESPNKERVQAMGLSFRGDEPAEFSRLLRIPHGRFVPPFLAAHQNALAPQEFMSRLLAVFLAGGFKFERNSGVRPDHVGVVLEFLALMKTKEKNPSDALRALIADPIKQFYEALSRATEHPLYCKVANELANLAESEMITQKQKQI